MQSPQRRTSLKTLTIEKLPYDRIGVFLKATPKGIAVDSKTNDCNSFIMTGDIIVSVNGKTSKSPQKMAKMIVNAEQVTLKIRRREYATFDPL